MGLKTFIKSSFDEMDSYERRLWLRSWMFGRAMLALVAIVAIIFTYLYYTPDTSTEADLTACEGKLEARSEEVCAQAESLRNRYCPKNM